MMILSTKNLMIAGGCSFTENWVNKANTQMPELWAKHKASNKYYKTKWKKIEPFEVWPDIVSRSQKLNLINTAVAGSGNDAIFHKVIDQIFKYKKQIKLVVVMWSNWIRKDIQVNPNLWESTTFIQSHMHNRINLFKTMYEIGALNEFACIDYFFRYSMMLEEICTIFDIKLVQCQGTSCLNSPHSLAEYQVMNEIDNKDPAIRQQQLEIFWLNREKVTRKKYEIDSKKFIKYFIDHYGFDYLEAKDNFIDWPLFPAIGGQCFKDIIKSNWKKFQISELDAHPNGAAHQMYAEKIIDKINE